MMVEVGDGVDLGQLTKDFLTGEMQRDQKSGAMRMVGKRC